MSVLLKVPAAGESIAEVEIGEWLKNEGEPVTKDENLVVVESEKATLEVPAPVSGRLTKILKQKGETARVGEPIAELEETTAAANKPAAKKPAGRADKPAKKPKPDTQPPDKQRENKAGRKAERPQRARAGELRVMPAARRALKEHGLRAEQVEASGPGGRLLKEDVLRHVAEETSQPRGDEGEATAAGEAEAAAPPMAGDGARREEVVRMSVLRREAAKRLVEAQRAAALLTTFNEIDMAGVVALRRQYGEAFEKKYGIKLGFMSFFVKATIDALNLVPQLNAEARADEIVYRNYCDIGIAVSTEKGLVVPVLRNAERMSFAEVERAVGDFAERARRGKLKPEEMRGGTFTITNGGIFGSLLSTPIVNPRQSGILGMHAIQERPVARDGQVVIRPMMYVALTYDHRVADGREAVLFLKRIKETVETPSRMLIEV
jgi:2-oxoglutarate dehydrogenase E2 component (dihydrolipoamide succinyltransferase)